MSFLGGLLVGVIIVALCVYGWVRWCWREDRKP